MIGTDTGVFRQSENGDLRRLDPVLLPGYDEDTDTAPRVNVAEYVDNTIWVGTAAGIGVYAQDGNPEGTVDAGFGGPVDVVAIVAKDGEVWVGTAEAGVYRRDDSGQWVQYNTQNTPGFMLSNQVRGIVEEEGRIWIATSEGIANYDLEAGAFADPIVDLGGLLPTNDITGISAGGGYVFAESDSGLAIRQPGGIWRTIVRNNQSIPAEAGTNRVRASTYSEPYLWVLLANSRLQPSGSILRRPADPNQNNPEDMMLFSLEELGLPALGDDSTASLRSSRVSQRQELLLAVCGDVGNPGGAAAAAASDFVRRELSDTALRYPLRGHGEDARLLTARNGQPMFVGREAGRPVADVLRPEAKDDFELPDIFSTPPTDCGAAGDAYWCLFGTEGFAKKVGDGAWQPTRSEVLGLLANADLRKIQVLEQSRWWMATDKGIFRYLDGGLLEYNQASTEAGLPDDDVRTILYHENKVYAGTSKGLGVFDTTDNSWQTFTSELGRHQSIRSLAIDVGNVLWIGSDHGLLKFGLEDGAEQVAFGTSNGLPDPHTHDIIIAATGQVYVATSGGLAYGDGVNDFSAVRFSDGLPGSLRNSFTSTDRSMFGCSAIMGLQG